MGARAHRALLAWYGRHARRLPWRERVSPYRTWVSEVMLQQTQAATALRYFQRFLRRFPSLRSLARASEREVLALWAGLGYYARARNLLRAARRIARGGGRIPEDSAELSKLPGIGPYTAAAIASIAFGKPCAVLDANVARVLTRFFALRTSGGEGPLPRRLWRLAQACLDRARPGEWNQALMELGALVCLPFPDQPLCGQCPLRAQCAARRLKLQGRLPARAARRKTTPLEWEALVIEDRGRVLLRKRPPTERLLPSHWGLPEPRDVPGARAGDALGEVRHSITRHSIRLSLRRASVPRGRLPGSARWFAKRRLREVLVSSLWRKALAKAIRPI